jgi:hypothetical protein
MTPPSDRPGIISTGIDVILVAVILACAGVLLFSAFQVVAGGVRAVTRWRRRRRGGDSE